jgi:putative aldouronate transport system substrate-binding protein
VDLEFVLYPSTDYLTKINLMVMAGGSDLQDIIIGNISDAMVSQWAGVKAIIPLKKYYDDPALSVNIRNAIKRGEHDFIPEITSPDGEIYGLPQLNLSSPGISAKAWYYGPWLEKLGIKHPSTTGEFAEYLRKMKATDLNGNGRNDEVGLAGNSTGIFAGWLNYLMNPFVYIGSQGYNLENGKISVPYNNPGWKEGLKYIRSLFASDLLPLEILTQDDNAVRALINSNPVRTGLFVYNSNSPINANNPAGDEFSVGLPLKGPNGTQYGTVSPYSLNIAMVISETCKNPEAAFRVGDFMMTEEVSYSGRYGQRTINWDYSKDVKDLSEFVLRYPDWGGRFVLYDDASFWGGSAVANSSWRNKGPSLITMEMSRSRMTPPPDPRSYLDRDATIAYNIVTYGPKENLGKLIYTEEEFAVVSELEATLKSYVNEMTASFLAGNRDIDVSWNAYLAEMDKIGLPKVLATVQQAYNRMYKK